MPTKEFDSHRNERYTVLNQYSKDLESFRTGEGQATEPEQEYSSST